jgi:hypothetical protein
VSKQTSLVETKRSEPPSGCSADRPRGCGRESPAVRRQMTTVKARRAAPMLPVRRGRRGLDCGS